MDNTFGVSSGKSGANLLDDVQSLVGRQLTALAEQAAQVLPNDVFHSDEFNSAGFADIEDANDVLMCYLASKQKFLLKALDYLRIFRKIRTDAFQGDDAINVAVVGFVHRAHAAQAQHLLNLEAAS